MCEMNKIYTVLLTVDNPAFSSLQFDKLVKFARYFPIITHLLTVVQDHGIILVTCDHLESVVGVVDVVDTTSLLEGLGNLGQEYVINPRSHHMFYFVSVP